MINKRLKIFSVARGAVINRVENVFVMHENNVHKADIGQGQIEKWIFFVYEDISAF